MNREQKVLAIYRHAKIIRCEATTLPIMAMMSDKELDEFYEKFMKKNKK